jgi:hypothetical protein
MNGPPIKIAIQEFGITDLIHQQRLSAQLIQ